MTFGKYSTCHSAVRSDTETSLHTEVWLCSDPQKFSHNLFVERKRRGKKKGGEKTPTFVTLFYSVAKSHTSFSINHRINKTVHRLTKQHCLVGQQEQLSAFPVFRIVSPLFTQIFTVIFPCPPVKGPVFCIWGGNYLLF